MAITMHFAPVIDAIKIATLYLRDEERDTDKNKTGMGDIAPVKGYEYD